MASSDSDSPKAPPVPESKKAPGGTGPSETIEETARRLHPIYRLGRDDQAKASEAEIAALREFANRMRVMPYAETKSITLWLDELDAELAKGKVRC